MLSTPDLRSLCRTNDFPNSAIDKGLLDAGQGKVLHSSLTLQGAVTQINARVAGEAKRPYEVLVEISPEDDDMYVNGECSCPLGYNCRHIVAAIAVAAGHLETPLLTTHSIAPIAHIGPKELPSPKPVPLAIPLASWLQSMTAPPAATPPESPPTRPAKQLIFLLSIVNPAYERPCVHLSLMHSALKKNGAFAKPTRISWYEDPREILDSPIYAHDRDILISLFGQCGVFTEINLDGPHDADLLRKILATNRCFWLRLNPQPLALGEPRPALPVWRELPDGSQQTALDIQPPASELLPFSPPWYLDPEACTCGPLLMEGDAQSAARWLSAPVVAPEQTVILAHHTARLHLPQPRQFQVKVRPFVRPVPVLKLSRVDFPKPVMAYIDDTWQRDYISSLDIARVEFEYDGIAVSLEDNQEFAQRRSADVLERIPRMRHAESDYVKEVRSSGIELASAVLWHNTPSEVKGAFTMRDKDKWLPWVNNILPGTVRRGWRVDMDRSFSYRPVAVDDWYSETAAEPSALDWFSYELGIVVEGERINLLPMLPAVLALLTKGSPEGKTAASIQLRIPDGRIVTLPAERLRNIAATLAELFDPDAFLDGKLKVARLRAAELIQLHDQAPWRGPADLRDLAAKLKAFEGIEKLSPPQNLQATLRPYQLEGLSWLQFLREHNFGGILADDMGLGKTVQALAHILAEKNAGRATAPSLVIAPTSLMPNWRAEAAKFAPDLKVLILHGGGRKEQFDQIANHDLIVTSYALLPRDREILEKHNYHLLVLDEAQYIKNPRTQWAEISRALKASHRLCMTGTPMENHLGELWSLMHFLSPGYLGSEKQFRKIYRDPIEKLADHERRAALAKRVRPFIMRRKKEDVAKDLPEKTEIIRNVELDGKQRDLYETIRLAMHEKVQQEVANKGLSRSHIVILDALLKLRQVCCDPRLVKLERAKAVRESAKLDLLKEMLPEMVAEGRKVLLFSQFTSMLDLIEESVNTLKIPFVRLTGDTTDRETPVNRFQAGDVPLFLISLKAGGTGLNLTAADIVIHYDPWWNPAVETQATDRAHRIGQTKKVFVYKLVTTGTVEEKILAMQERKKELVSGLLGEGAQQNLQLTKDDLNHLFDPLA